MIDYRLAKEGDIVSLKEIWKRCFGDSDKFIDFYFTQRFKENETLLRLHKGTISAMLTIIPVTLITPNIRRINSGMLYAIATHPEYQNRGFATQLMDMSNQYLKNNKELSIVVPAIKDLFGFYCKQGYRDGFYITETLLGRETIESFSQRESCKCTIYPITPEEYNQRRNNQLRGRLHLAYDNKEIAYQKKVSRLSGTDIYAIDIEEIHGCVAVERIGSDKVLMKELLLPEKLLQPAIKQIAVQLPVSEYLVRTPAYLGEDLGGLIRPFGMLRDLRETNLGITSDELGYLGLAFD